jgi:hypothetical protein
VVALVFSMMIVLGSAGSGLDAPPITEDQTAFLRGSYEVPILPVRPEDPERPDEEGCDVPDEGLAGGFDAAIVVPLPLPYPGPEPVPVMPAPVMPVPTWPEWVDPIGSGEVKLDLPCPPWTDSEAREAALAHGIVIPLVHGPRLDVLFCLDTTGSMGDEIHVAKEAILDIAAVVADGYPVPEVRYGLVIYRDLRDDYVTQVFDFMTAEELAEVLKGVRAGGGNDYRESVSEALHRSVHDVSWDLEEAACAIYLIGDAPPHTDYDNGYDHILAATDAAARGIVINAIGCSGIKGNEKEFMEVVDITGGIFVYLEYDLGGDGGGDADGDCEMYSDLRTDHSGEGNCSYDSPPSAFRGSSSEGSSDGGDYDNDLDDVLADMIKTTAAGEGVKYDD